MDEASYISLLVGLGQRQSQWVLWEADGLTVASHVGVATNRVPHLGEGQAAHGDGAAAQHLEARLAVEGHQEVLAHEHGPAHIGEATQVL